MVLSAIGLGHIQGGPLLVNLIYRKSKLWGWIIGTLLVAAVVIVGLEEKDLLEHSVAFVLAVACFGFLSATMASRALAAFAVGGLIHVLIKEFIDRERPSMLRDAVPLENVYSTAAWPSGHTTTSMAMGMVLGVLFWRSGHRTWAVLAFSFGPLVGLSRIRVGVHWPTDVIGGLLLGVFAAALTLLVYPPKSEPPR